jgi:hypothetical protein
MARYKVSVDATRFISFTIEADDGTHARKYAEQVAELMTEGHEQTDANGEAIEWPFLVNAYSDVQIVSLAPEDSK